MYEVMNGLPERSDAVNWLKPVTPKKNFSIIRSIIQNNVHSTPIHEKTGTRRNALICTPHSLLELPDLRDSNKLCGVQIGIVEVVYLNDCII